MRVQLRYFAAILAFSLAHGLSGCGNGNDSRESSGSSAKQAPAAGAPPSATRTAARPSADAFGGATTTTTVSEPAPNSTATAGPYVGPPAATDGGTMPMSDLGTSAAAPGPLTPKTINVAESTDPSCYKAAVTVCQLELAILKATNAHRDGTKQLTLDPKLSFVARGWSGQQQAAGTIGHAGFPDDREVVYKAEFGAVMPFFLGAENVGTTYGTDKLTVDQLATEIVDMWWNSAGHRANMLGAYAVIGVGVSISADARTLMATQLFGAP